MLTKALIALIALLHVYIMILEMVLWTRPRGRRAFGMTEAFARDTSVLAANQGLYNGFLAAGLVWALLADPFGAGAGPAWFFLTAVLIAGLFGAATASRRILFVQALPAALALAALALGL